ncbi:hypothetical protein STEG23_024596 [Scotinomys teguina]
MYAIVILENNSNLTFVIFTCSGWLFQLSLEVLPPLMFSMTVTPLGWDQDCSLKIREPEVLAPFWFLDPGGWSKTAAVGLYFIFPGICTLSLRTVCKIPSCASLDARRMEIPSCASSDAHRMEIPSCASLDARRMEIPSCASLDARRMEIPSCASLDARRMA